MVGVYLETEWFATKSLSCSIIHYIFSTTPSNYHTNNDISFHDMFHHITAENAALEFEVLWEMYRSAKRYKTNQYKDVVMNHIQGNACLVTKKGLFFSIRAYALKNNLNLHEIVPRTFYVHANGKNSDEEGDGIVDDTEGFLAYNRDVEAAAVAGGSEETKKKDEGIIWICKPGT